MTSAKKSSNFWETLSLGQMTKEQWEALCDGCGRCCLHKFEDQDTEKIFFTDVACRYLDDDTCKCPHYESRQEYVPDCLSIHPNWGNKFNWLPSTCAYRLLHQEESLFDWHPLISGDTNSVHMAGISVRGRTFSDADISDNETYLHVIEWAN